MGKCEKRYRRFWMAMVVVIGFSGPLPAMLTGDLLTGLSYYSTFEDTSKGISAELPTSGAGAWNTTNAGAFTTLGAYRMLNLASYSAWTDKQGVLQAGAEAFTIMLRAKVGTTNKGLLFAFGPSSGGTSGAGGLALRRGDAAGTFVVTTGQAVPVIEYVPTSDASDSAYHNYAITYSDRTLTLYVDGIKVGAEQPDGAVIASQFQWRSRHGNPFNDKESQGNGAIDALGVWTRALSVDEIQQVASAWEPALEPHDFNLPDVWSSVFTPEPTTAYPAGLWSAYAFGADDRYRQQLQLGGDEGTVPALTVKLTDSGVDAGVSGTTTGGESSTGAASTLTQDAWIDVASGSYEVLAGGSRSGWASGAANGKHNVVGDAYLRVEQGATVKWLVGAGLEGCSGPTQTGNVGIVVEDGADVGTLIGAWTVKHGATATLEGDVRILVSGVLAEMDAGTQGSIYYDTVDPFNMIIGGSASIDTNSGSRASYGVTGAVSLEVAPSAEATGTFGKTLVGGAYSSISNPGTGASSVDSVDLCVNAPGVEFPKGIYLAGYAASKNNVKVTGDAVLTLKGGSFKGPIAVGGGEGTVTVGGSSGLVIDGGTAGIDLSGATVADTFDTVTLKSSLNLGTNRLSNSTLTLEGEQTLTLTLTGEELAARRVVLGQAESVPEGLTVQATAYPEGESAADWELTVVAGQLCYGARSTSHTWKTPEGTSAWADGLPDFHDGDNVTFAENQVQEPVTLSEDVRVGTMTVPGNYVIGGNGRISADTVTVGVDGTLTLEEPAFKYLRLTPSGANGTGDNAYPGIAEFVLYNGDAPIAWPRGTTIRQVNANGTVVEPVWSSSGNEKPNALIDGVYGETTQTYTNPYDGSTGTYSASWDRNKWWPTDAAGACAVITLGAPVSADGYMIWHTDHVPRSPNACKLEASVDGETWVTLDDRTFFSQSERPENVANQPYGTTPFAMSLPLTEEGVVLSVAAGMTVTGKLCGAGWVAGDLTFVEGSTLRVSTDGILTVSGTVSGTVNLDLSAWGELDDSKVRPVLRAPKAAEGTFSVGVPEGFVTHYSDGAYWVARALTQPLSLMLGSEAEWTQATWQDSSVSPVAVAPAQWDVLPAEDITAEVSATADATLTLESARSVGSFVVQASESTLTLSGETLSPNALTVAGQLSASSSSLALPSGATINGTLTYDVASESESSMPEGITGAGTIKKTGAGLLSAQGVSSVACGVEVLGGSMSAGGGSNVRVYTIFSSPVTVGGGTELAEICFTGWHSCGDFRGGLTLRNNGRLRPAHSGSSGAEVAGAITVDAPDGSVSIGSPTMGNYDIPGNISGVGALHFVKTDGGNAVYLKGVISDKSPDEPLKLVFEGGNPRLRGSNTYTGGTQILGDITVENAQALGKGPVEVAADKTLTVPSGTILNVYGALSGEGTVSGAVQLMEGASLDASVGVLTVDTLSVAEGVTVPVTLPETVVSGTKLLGWTTGPTGATFEATTTLSSTAGLVAKADGLYYEELSFDSIGSDGAGIATLSEASQRRLAAAAFAAGATSVAAVTGTTAGRELKASEIDAALLCFDGVLSTAVSEGVATLMVAYDFGIDRLSIRSFPTEGGEASYVVLAVRVQHAVDAEAQFSAGTTIQVFVNDAPMTGGGIGGSFRSW